MTGKQNAFVIEYLKDLNATQAAIRAGYSDKSAMAQGCQLLNHAKVKEAIFELQKASAVAQGITKERIEKEWSCIGFLDPADCFDENGALLDIKKMPEKTRRAISSIEVTTKTYGQGEKETTEETKKIRFWNKNESLTEMGKIIGVYVEDNKQKTDGIKELLGLIDGRSKGLPDSREAENS
jgi:phage terminase small subunit